MQTPSEIEAYLAGKPVSPEFLAELESHTSNLLTQLETLAVQATQLNLIKSESHDQSNPQISNQA